MTNCNQGQEGGGVSPYSHTIRVIQSLAAGIKFLFEQNLAIFS